MGALAVKKHDLDEDEKAEKASVSKEEIISFAKGVIHTYFTGKSYYCGGEIPPHLLLSPKRVDLVLDCTFDRAISIAYEALEEDLTADDEEYVAAGGVSPDIKSLVTLLHDMSRHGVPQELSNGMLVLYLEFVMGANVVYV